MDIATIYSFRHFPNVNDKCFRSNVYIFNGKKNQKRKKKWWYYSTEKKTDCTARTKVQRTAQQTYMLQIQQERHIGMQGKHNGRNGNNIPKPKTMQWYCLCAAK